MVLCVFAHCMKRVFIKISYPRVQPNLQILIPILEVDVIVLSLVNLIEKCAWKKTFRNFLESKILRFEADKFRVVLRKGNINRVVGSMNIIRLHTATGNELPESIRRWCVCVCFLILSLWASRTFLWLLLSSTTKPIHRPDFIAFPVCIESYYLSFVQFAYIAFFLLNTYRFSHQTSCGPLYDPQIYY